MNLKSYAIELKWALIFTGMMLLWMLLEKLAGLHSEHIAQHATFTNFVAIPAIGVYVLALLDKRKRFYGGSMTYLQGFVSGLIITLIVTVLSPVTQLITSLVISPEYFPNMIRYAVESGMMTQEQAEANFNLPNYLIQNALFTPVIGLVTSALVALFTQRKARPKAAA